MKDWEHWDRSRFNPNSQPINHSFNYQHQFQLLYRFEFCTVRFLIR
jgi:hypothetical protein